MSFVLRPVRYNDLDSLYNCATTGEGLPSLPGEKNKLCKHIRISMDCFSGQNNGTGYNSHLFVLEDLKTGDVAGVSALKTANTYTKSFSDFALKGDKEPPNSLELVKVHRQYTELATLYLLKNFRKTGLSRLLSLGRYLFIAAFPHFFHEHLIARLRGHAPRHYENSFWFHLGKIFDKAPLFPIHINGFPKKVRDKIGSPYRKTIPAYKLLEKEGFSCQNYFDFYDSGPRLEAVCQEVRSVKNSTTAEVREIQEQSSGPFYLIGNERKDFRAVKGQLTFIQNHSDAVILSPKDAEALEVEPGDRIRYISEKD